MPGLRGCTLYLLNFKIYLSTQPVNKQIPAFFNPKNKEYFADPIQ